jgi:hypothetical protein
LATRFQDALIGRGRSRACGAGAGWPTPLPSGQQVQQSHGMPIEREALKQSRRQSLVKS